LNNIPAIDFFAADTYSMTKVFTSVHPFNQEVIAEYPVMDSVAVDVVLQRSEQAFAHWKSVSLNQRCDLMLQMAQTLRNQQEALARLITLEMGKILKESMGEVEKCAWNCSYYAEHVEYMLEPEFISSDADESYVVCDPIGCVFAIMPWNFPFWQVYRFAAPVLLAGNTIILKHAPNVTGCALAMERLFLEAGFPEHVFQTVVIDTDETEHIIAHDIVQGVTLTGSERAGSAVAALAGKHIKKTVLELGGSDALIVLRDADIELAARVALQSRYQNAGQSCIASKRFIVQQDIKDAFLEAMLKGLKDLRQGDPLLSETTTGPMARIDLAGQLHNQQNASVKKGAQLLIGGDCQDANYMPALLDFVKPGMPAFDEELFGPVAGVISVSSVEEAVQLANSSRYGLGASVFTRDMDAAKMIARNIHSGSVFINALVKSDPRLPFGGVKKSGYGRELSHYGLKEFTNIKTVYIRE